ncbi:MAG: 2-dehydropantoate 2-reductase, partial [Pseudomonadota bacterium]
MPQRSFTSTVVVGAGAVGSFYGAMLARAGHQVTLIGRAAHVQATLREGLQLQMAGQLHRVNLAATTDLGAVREADLVLVCVKSTDTDAVACEIAPWLRADALVLSLQNGVENADLLARHIRHQPVVPAVVYVATAMPAPGVVAHHGRGDLVIGRHRLAAARSNGNGDDNTGATTGDDAAPGALARAESGDELQRRLQALVDLFASAGVAVRISPDVMAELWSKLMVNCAYNAISGLAQQPYGRMAELPPVRAVQRAVVHEVVAVAHAAGVALVLDDALAAMERIAPAMPAQLSSTAQDM